METAQLFDFPLTDPTRAEMGRRGARRLLVQGAIEVGPQAPTSPVQVNTSVGRILPHRYSLRRMIPEQPVTIPFAPGQSLEGALTLPDRCPAGVVLCHPHPRYGGDVDSPVVVAAAEAGAGQGLATLRFNFRGVGDSGGAWDEGRGEQDDVRAALALLQQRLQPIARLALAGYSFGASMSSRVAVATST